MTHARWLRRLAVVCCVVAAAPFVAVEAAARWHLRHVRELPQRPSTLLPEEQLRTLAAALGLRLPARMEPLYPWTVLGSFTGAAVPSKHRPGALAHEVARLPQTDGQRRLHRAIDEVSLAIRVSRDFTAEEALTWVAGHAYFGRGCFGLEAAAAGLLGRRPEELDLADTALLFGLLRQPSMAGDVERVRRRRDFVLARLRDEGLLSFAGYEEATARRVEPLAGCRAVPECAPR